ncbi:MAG: hypothetical protein ACI9HK_004452 [Pirellulaceae bacterium]|jgi:hypothetical protein
MRFPATVLSLFALLSITCVAIAAAQDASNQDKAEVTKTQKTDEQSATTGGAAAASATKTTTAKPEVAAHIALLKDAKAVAGLVKLYHSDTKVFAEFSSADYASEYIVLISIARGIGRGSLLGGMSWGFGDDWVWQFRKIGKQVHIVRKNVRFRAKSDSPESSAVKNAYTDSVLFSLPITTTGPNGGDLVDLTSVFMSDLPQISQELPGFMFSASKSSWAAVKGFKDNIELEVAATYASSGREQFDSVADTRGVTINVHYSISKLPTTGYTPRLADDRVGYFLTAIMDYSKKSDRDQFVRYINRWNLKKADASAKLSPPEEPIIFWLERTVPFKYRKPIRDGISEWNRAFEKAGFVDAIEVRQQPDDAEWDPEDINYNTFRWITANAGFAMGPSRVNPYTGQILDADIIFDASFLQFWTEEFETLTPESIAGMTGGIIDRPMKHATGTTSQVLPRKLNLHDCMLNRGMAQQYAFGSAALMTRAATPEQRAEMQEQMIVQGLKEVTMHEVGHTLGLRHNFKASKYRNLKDLNNSSKTSAEGTVASVMDYTPTNIAPKGQKQGDYYSTTVGPYDVWAIEYGYKPLSGGPADVAVELKKIAARSGEAALLYATDEDTGGTDPDPDTNRFDLGDDAIAYAKLRAQIVSEIIPDLLKRTTKDGDDYTQARRAFNTLLSQHGQGMFFVSRYVGGVRTSRTHKGDKNAKAPTEIVSAKLQRDSLALIEEQVLSPSAYQYSPELYSHLAASNWRHWGATRTARKDFPVHDVIAMWQARVLSQLISSVTITRIHDSELKIAADKDAFTTAELLERLTNSIFSEVNEFKAGEYTNRKPYINSIRRNLQRMYMRRLSMLAMGYTFAPEDCATLAHYQLSEVRHEIEQLLKKHRKELDVYTLAHLQETSVRIEKVLDARLSLLAP